MATDEIAQEKQARYEAALKVLNMLAETWPTCFKHEDDIPVPLAIGIYHRVQAELGEMVDEAVLGRAFENLLPTACLPGFIASARRPARRSGRQRGGTRHRRRAGQGETTQAQGQGEATR